MEIWKDIKGYEGKYQVSNYGNVKSLPRTRKAKFNSVSYKQEIILKPKTANNGYLLVNLYIESKRVMFSIHRLVALTFIDNPNNYPVINHKNGIKTDNRVENLEWCTQSHNRIHALENNLAKVAKGETHCQARLTNEQVLEIRNDNRKQWQIAKQYGISQTMVSHIKLKTAWKHI